MAKKTPAPMLETIDGILAYVEGYADGATKDDPVHVELPRMRFARDTAADLAAALTELIAADDDEAADDPDDDRHAIALDRKCAALARAQVVLARVEGR